MLLYCAVEDVAFSIFFPPGTTNCVRYCIGHQAQTNALFPSFLFAHIVFVYCLIHEGQEFVTWANDMFKHKPMHCSQVFYSSYRIILHSYRGLYLLILCLSNQFISLQYITGSICKEPGQISSAHSEVLQIFQATQLDLYFSDSFLEFQLHIFLFGSIKYVN